MPYIFRPQHFMRVAQFYAIAIFVMGKPKHPRMMAHDNFLFSSHSENGKAKGRTWGYDSLAKARGTLRQAAHTALEAHTMLV